MSSASIKLIGEKELASLLSQLPKRVRVKYLRRAVSKAARPIVQSAKRLAPKETGLLRKSIGVKIKTYSSRGRVAAIIGPRTNMGAHVEVETPFGVRKRWRDPSKYARMVEFGTAPHGNHPGAVPRPFMRPAFSSGGPVAISTIKAELKSAIAIEARKRR